MGNRQCSGYPQNAACWPPFVNIGVPILVVIIFVAVLGFIFKIPDPKSKVIDEMLNKKRLKDRKAKAAKMRKERIATISHEQNMGYSYSSDDTRGPKSTNYGSHSLDCSLSMTSTVNFETCV
ncbi:unnamed protein product [Owenia fusiformis]|uniref:Uncharacterized protein n=1 Tax=Owenia fusiformis TaxID=6347 RepID=A0A8J1TZL0_OWEFU|nr:unnamed protein product [Owenia fusiformis]